MKRLNVQPPPKEDMPESYKQMSSVDLEEQPVSVSAKQQPESASSHELPKSHLYKRMKKLSSFKKIKRSYKLESQKEQFVSDLKQLFKHLDVEEHQFDTELLVELLNATEEYFIYGTRTERELSKFQVVSELMLPFFGGDDRILLSFISSLKSKVKKSNIFRRIGKRIINFFL